MGATLQIKEHEALTSTPVLRTSSADCETFKKVFSLSIFSSNSILLAALITKFIFSFELVSYLVKIFFNQTAIHHQVLNQQINQHAVEPVIFSTIPVSA